MSIVFINLINIISKKGEWYERYSIRIGKHQQKYKTFQGHSHTAQQCSSRVDYLRAYTNHINSVVAMARIKRVACTDSTDGVWQLAQLKEGWYTKDFDFSTNEFVMGRCEDIETITRQQARLLAYADYSKLDEKTKRIIWPKCYEGE